MSGKASSLTNFIEGAEAWNKYFIDRESGGTWLSVNLNGEIKDPAKASRFKSSYHNLEHCLLNFIYLPLWVEEKPFELHFSIEPQLEAGYFYPVPVEDTSIKVQGIKINGWVREDAAGKDGRRIGIPTGENIRIKVILTGDR